jgi:hypothetical protein
VISPFSTFKSQISGIKNPQVIASINGGHRFIVSSSRKLIALNDFVGIALIQLGTPRFAGTGCGSFPSSSGGQRNLNVTGSCCTGSFLSERLCAL